ncbi:ROK family protein [Lysinibacter sp. HNR]|uniref:ROK family protein n=1 Tax=Lysinibacter sp. HNR TaxID=3031408 RepID=UPI00243589B4|nr:ROK family protein [Lysinibacter sp. HNR]WGD37520.1 ROK family protein [Lysinibacter sp. HNR]
MHTDASRAVLGIDVGGTKTLVGLVDSHGKVLVQEQWPTRNTARAVSDVEHLGTQVERFLRGVCSGHSPLGPVSIAAVGAGFPEYVDARGRLTASEVISWRQQPSRVLEEVLQRVLGDSAGSVPVLVESDVRAGAVGEMLFGAARDLSSFVYVSLGTGLSSTIGSEGRILTGYRGEAIALGEWPVSPGEFELLGAHNLEQYVSGAGLSRRFALLTGEHLITREIASRAAAGPGMERDFLSDAGRALAGALDSIVSFIDPERIVLGGGLGTAPGVLADALDAEFMRLMTRRPGSPALVRAHNGSLSGLLGAAATGWRAVTFNV